MSEEINLANKIFKSLPPKLKDAIVDWESSGWAVGELEKSARKKGELFAQIAGAYGPLRDYLFKKHGTHINLWRGIRTGSDHHQVPDPARQLFSWTSQRKEAEVFAGMRNAYRKDMVMSPISDAAVERAVTQYERSGFATFQGYQIRRNREHPIYFDIFKNNQYVTDGDDIREFLSGKKIDRDQYNQDVLNRGKVYQRRINVKDILLVTNNLNSKEFVVIGEK